MCLRTAGRNPHRTGCRRRTAHRLREAILSGKEDINAKVITSEGVSDLHLNFTNLTADEREILVEGCLMNYYAVQNKK